jgi:tetratricopeptide (TPR) repeat protein
MDQILREQIYNSLILKESEELLEIWRKHDTDQWNTEVFEIVEAILVQRLGTLPVSPNQVQLRQVMQQLEGYLRAGELEQAMRACETALRLAPNLAKAYYFRAQIFAEMGQLEQAIYDYQKVVRLRPSFEEAWKSLKDAELDFAEEFQATPAKQHLDEALEYAYEGELETALAKCELARQSLPAIAPAHNRLGMVLEELGQLQPAVEAYREAIRLNPRFDAARTNLRNASLKLEESQYRHSQAADEPALEDLALEPLEMVSGNPADEIVRPAPGWVYLDQRAQLLIGWPGHRNRPGHSGLAPLDADFEAAHICGVIIRQVLTGRFRTRNPIYLLLMLCLGILASFPLLAVVPLLMGNIDAIPFLLANAPYWLFGLVLLANVYVSGSMPLPLDD